MRLSVMFLFILIVLWYSDANGGRASGHARRIPKKKRVVKIKYKFGRYGNKKPSYVPDPPYGWSSNGKPLNPKLYRTKLTSYDTHRAYTFTHPPAYSKPYSGPESMQSYAPPAPSYRVHSVPVMQSYGHSNLLQNAVFYGLGRARGSSFHRNHYYNYGSNFETTTTPKYGKHSTTERPTVDLDEEQLYVWKQIPFRKVKKGPIDYQPILLEDSIQNLPFYGYQYPTWNELKIVAQKEKEVTGFGRSLVNAILGFTNWWRAKPAIEPEWENWIDQHTTTTTEEPSWEEYDWETLNETTVDSDESHENV